MRNFGYKICYKERGSKKYIRYFMTYTYPQALKILYYFISYPPDERETDSARMENYSRNKKRNPRRHLAGVPLLGYSRLLLYSISYKETIA